MPSRAALAAAGLMLVLVGCTSPPAGPPTPAPTAPPGTPAPPESLVDGPFTPLVITPLAPDPIPVRGSDGQVHVSYELTVLNAGPRDGTITSVETLADGPDGRVVTTVQGPEVIARSIIVGEYLLPPVPATTVPAGKTVLLVLDDVYPDRTAVPAAVTHRISATFGPLGPEQAPFASNFPDDVTQVGGVVRTGTGEPVRIGPPLRGPDWFAFNACCELSAHRGAMIPIGGRINGSERYAIDWVQIDPTVAPLFDAATGEPVGLFRGEQTRNEDYLSYDQPLIAVADGTVAYVVDGMPDAVPPTVLTGLTAAQLGGNYVVLEIGPGVYAFYAHIRPGTVAVKVGDRVTKGQEIGRLGNSGSSTAPHLHFHVMSSTQPLTATNLPFEIEAFDLQGTAAESGFVPASDAGPRTDELPLIDSVVRFP
jgi:hypothetical protein